MEVDALVLERAQYYISLASAPRCLQLHLSGSVGQPYPLTWAAVLFFPPWLLMASYIALCCYPNVNGAIRNLSLNTSTASIFLQLNYFRENIWVRIWVQFHFLYIFVGRVDRIFKTSHLTKLSFYLFLTNLQSFGDELNRSSKTTPINI